MWEMVRSLQSLTWPFISFLISQNSCQILVCQNSWKISLGSILINIMHWFWRGVCICGLAWQMSQQLRWGWKTVLCETKRQLYRCILVLTVAKSECLRTRTGYVVMNSDSLVFLPFFQLRDLKIGWGFHISCKTQLFFLQCIFPNWKSYWIFNSVFSPLEIVNFRLPETGTVKQRYLALLFSKTLRKHKTQHAL